MAERVPDGTVIPLFPLPSIVFFPRTVLPLHMFEERYRALARDASEGEGLIAMALLRPGWVKDYEGHPAFHTLGTVGRIHDLEALPDGRFNLTLHALDRADYDELPSDDLYRVVRVRPRPEADAREDAELAGTKLDLLATHQHLLGEIAGEASRNAILNDRLPLCDAVNRCCAMLPVDPEVRQSLLEEDDLRRRLDRAVQLTHQALEHVLKLKSQLAN